MQMSTYANFILLSFANDMKMYFNKYKAGKFKLLNKCKINYVITMVIKLIVRPCHHLVNVSCLLIQIMSGLVYMSSHLDIACKSENVSNLTAVHPLKPIGQPYSFEDFCLIHVFIIILNVE